MHETIRHQNHTHEITLNGAFGLFESGTEIPKTMKKTMGADAMKMKSMRKPTPRRPQVAYRTSGVVGRSEAAPQVKGAACAGSGHGVPSCPPVIRPTVEACGKAVVNAPG